MNKFWENSFKPKKNHDCCANLQTKDRSKSMPLVLGIIAACTSSICCIGPAIAFLVFGISAVAFIAKYDLYFKTLTIVLLIFGLIFIWYKQGNKSQKSMTILVISFIFFNLILYGINKYFLSQLVGANTVKCNDCLNNQFDFRNKK